ncbi:hypothetical protein AtEden1_MTg0321951 (mitochondrion) [Arabidopsis thaliana]
MFEPMFKQNPSPGWKECPPSSDKEGTTPERLDEGREMRRGSTLFRPRCYDCRSLSSFRPLAYWDSSLRALPAH